MTWMLPDITIILATLGIVFWIFIRVGKQLEVKEEFFRLWVWAWLLSIIHYVGQFAGVKYNSTWGDFVNALFLGISAIVFVLAAESIRGRSPKTLAPYCIPIAILLAVWSAVDNWQLAPAITNRVGYGWALAALFAFAGLSHWFDIRKYYSIGGAILAYNFFFWSACFVFATATDGSAFANRYEHYIYQFSNLPKPIAAIGMLIYMLEAERLNVHRQRDFAESLIENAPDGIFILDIQQNLSRVNKRFAAMCGLPAELIVGKSLSCFISLAEDEHASKTPRTNEISTISAHYQSRIEAAGRGPIDVLVTTKPIVNSGRVVGAMGIVKDITQRLQLEHQLRQSEKMASIGLMVSGVAHELNNPLTSVIGFTELSLRDGSLGDVVGRRLRIVLSEARRTRTIVQKLLSAVRQQKNERAPVRVNRLITDTIALRESDFKLNNIEIQAELDPDAPAVMADASDIQQVLINLMQNAFDALSEGQKGGLVVIRTLVDRDHVVIEVSDDGPGTAEPGRVFDPFYTTKEVGKGTGLGLSICYQIVKTHEGDIFVENLPKGTMFTVRLPIAPASAVELAMKKLGGAAKTLKGRVLVIDDEPMIASFCESILSSAGFEVQTSLTGADAIEKLAVRRFDAIVTDYKMPGKISGADIYDWVRGNRPGQQDHIIFMTGDSVNPSTHDFLKRCGSPVVFKPFDGDELVEKVRTLVSESRENSGAPAA
ncbi:MAG TPA: ATP-binding protein [Blastocatellia bacterium]|nr:ATP-binding protein [Blastocatellia bacterium]